VRTVDGQPAAGQLWSRDLNVAADRQLALLHVRLDEQELVRPGAQLRLLLRVLGGEDQHLGGIDGLESPARRRRIGHVGRRPRQHPGADGRDDGRGDHAGRAELPGQPGSGGEHRPPPPAGQSRAGKHAVAKLARRPGGRWVEAFPEFGEHPQVSLHRWTSFHR
jgi:hypothetical protein